MELENCGFRDQGIKSFGFGDLVIDGIQGFRDLEIYKIRDLEFGDLRMQAYMNLWVYIFMNWKI